MRKSLLQGHRQVHIQKLHLIQTNPSPLRYSCLPCQSGRMFDNCTQSFGWHLQKNSRPKDLRRVHEQHSILFFRLFFCFSLFAAPIPSMEFLPHPSKTQFEICKVKIGNPDEFFVTNWSPTNNPSPKTPSKTQFSITVLIDGAIIKAL